MALNSRLRFLFDSVGQLFLPADCVVCRKSISGIDNGLCPDCWQQMLYVSANNYCRRCGRDVSKYGILEGACPACMDSEICFDAIARAGVYGSILRRTILAFKNESEELKEKLSPLINAALAGSGFADDIDFYVPVPLHWSRRLTRGYNQASLLLKTLEPGSGKISTDLVRVKKTRPQPQMVSDSKRAKNVAGAFAVREGHNFTGKRVCLVDDIKTSGATLNECAKVLKQAGALKVYALVAAVAGQNQ